MSDDEIQVPRFQKEDLLKVDFNIKGHNEANLHTSSGSLSLNDSLHRDSRFSFGNQQKKSPINNRQVEKPANPPPQKNEHIDPRPYKKPKPFVEEKKQPSPGPIFQIEPRKPNLRMRRSSFFEVEDFSLSRQDYDSPSYSNQFLEDNIFQTDSSRNQEEKDNFPYFGTEHSSSAHLMLRDFLGNQGRKENKPNIKPFVFKEEMSFGLTTSPQKVEEKKPVQIKNKIVERYPEEEKKQVVIRPNQRKNVGKVQPICFKCGGKHYYNQCTGHSDLESTSDIRCLNCKQQGHTAMNCAEPKRCNYCNSVQHLARDCPTIAANKQSKICLNCNLTGHFAKECPKPKKCHLCHQPGHQIKNCPKNRHNNPDSINEKLLKPRVCFNCQKEGHYANQCTIPQRCHNCNQQGHYSRDCPIIVRSLSVAASLNNSEKQERTQSVQKAQSEPQAKKIKPVLGKFIFKRNFKSGASDSVKKQRDQKESKSKKSKKRQDKKK